MALMTTPVVIENPDLPPGLLLHQQVMAISSLKSAYRVQVGSVSTITTSGSNILSFQNLVSGAGDAVAITNDPDLAVVKNLAFGKWPGASFTHLGTDYAQYEFAEDGYNQNHAGAWTWACIFMAPTGLPSGGVMGTDDGTNTSRLALNTSLQLQCRHGSTSDTAIATTSNAIVYDVPAVALVSNDGTGTVRARLNGGPIASASGDNAVSTDRILIGGVKRLSPTAHWVGDFKGAWLFNADLLSTDLDSVALIEEMAEAVYGVQLVN